jgi:hypothetical protein
MFNDGRFLWGNRGKEGKERGRKGKHQKVPLENVVPLPLTKR